VRPVARRRLLVALSVTLLAAAAARADRVRVWPLRGARAEITGLIHENMSRGYGWRLLDMGRRI